MEGERVLIKTLRFRFVPQSRVNKAHQGKGCLRVEKKLRQESWRGIQVAAYHYVIWEKWLCEPLLSCRHQWENLSKCLVIQYEHTKARTMAVALTNEKTRVCYKVHSEFSPRYFNMNVCNAKIYRVQLSKPNALLGWWIFVFRKKWIENLISKSF